MVERTGPERSSAHHALWADKSQIKHHDDASGGSSVRWSRIALYVVLAAALTFGISAVPMSAAGQPAGKIQRVGYLAGSSLSSGTQRVREALPQGLRELGWVEGQNVVFQFRFAEGRYDRLRDLTAEQRRVDPASLRH